MDTEAKTVIAAIERLEAEQRRRIAEKVEKGDAIREELHAVCAGPEDAADVLERLKASRIAELRAAGEKREIIFDPIEVILTGVPRPGRDEKYFERLNQERAKPEEVRQREKEAAAASGIDFHGGSKSHEPEYKPPPMSKALEEPPAEALKWRGIIVQVRASNPELGDPGQIIEGRFAVWQGMVRVEDMEGRFVGTQALSSADDPLSIARRLLRERHGKSAFWGAVSYPSLKLV
jgi:hypothetical protein